MRCEGCGDALRAVKRPLSGAADPTTRPPMGTIACVCDNEHCDRFGLTVQRDGTTEPTDTPRGKEVASMASRAKLTSIRVLS